MRLPEPLIEAIGQAAYLFSEVQPLLPTYVHLLLSALFPIFTGAHASLSRPPSAAKAKKRRKTRDGRVIEEDEEDSEQRMEGLSNTDVILFPVLAGCTLAGLYFLIKWLGSADLLNKILNWYIGFFSLASVSKLVSDGLDVLHSFLFPHDYVDQGIVFHVDPIARRALPTSPAPASQIRYSALPGMFSRLPLPQALQNFFWFFYVLPNRKLTFGAHIHSIFSAKIKLGIHGIEGLMIGFLSVFWYNFVSKPWWLTNLMGFGFSYTALQITSPSTFGTGSMLLFALFFYDIYFVFFTPMMVTVAKELDIPVKLLFPRPSGPEEPANVQALSMLGLGDVVLPGTLIGLALRFDLYRFYLSKQRKASTITEDASALNVEEESDPFTDEVKAEAVEQPASKASTKIIKATYLPVGECWGDRFWTASIFTRSKHGYKAKNAFPKPYFHASVIGYIAAMLATLTAMQLTNHPQPALLYLSPGVVGSIWITAYIRGELGAVWAFSDQDEEEEDSAKKISDASKQTDSSAQNKSKDNEAAANQTRSSFFSLSRQTEREKRADDTLRKYIKRDDGELTDDEDKAQAEKSTEKTSSEKSDQKPSNANSSRTLVSFYIKLPSPLAYAETYRDEVEMPNGNSAKPGIPPKAAERTQHIDKKARLA